MDLFRHLRRGTVDDLIASLLIVAAYFVLRAVLVTLVRKAAFRSERLRIRWLGAAKRTSNAALLLGMIVVWGTELRTFALSAAALGAALIVAIREVVLCVSAFVVNAAGDGFSIGDRIVVGAVSGDVIEHGMFSTTLLEVDGDGRRTGRTYFMPNSVLFTQTLVNETSEGDYVTRTFSLGTVTRERFREAEAIASNAAEQVLAPYRAAALEALENSAKRSGLPPAPASVEVMATANGEVVNLAVRMPMPVRRRGAIEQDVLRGFVDGFGTGAGRGS